MNKSKIFYYVYGIGIKPITKHDVKSIELSSMQTYIYARGDTLYRNNGVTVSYVHEKYKNQTIMNKTQIFYFPGSYSFYEIITKESMKSIKISNMQTAKHVTDVWYLNNGVCISFVHKDYKKTRTTVFQKIKTLFVW